MSLDLDAYTPAQMAARLEQFSVAKAALPLLPLALVASDASLGFAAGRLLAGLVFSLGLVLVVEAGAELFTGNNLVGGSVLVALVYWLIYVRRAARAAA